MEARPAGPDAAPPRAAVPAPPPPTRSDGSRLSGQPSSSGHAVSALQRLMQRNLHRSSKSGQPSQQQLSQQQPQPQPQEQEERLQQQNGASHEERQQGDMAAAATAATSAQPPADEQPEGQERPALDAGGGAPECTTGSAGAAAGQAPAACQQAAAMAAGNQNASASPTPHIVPAAAVQEAARRIQLVGVRLKQGSWNARVHLAVDERGRPTGATWLLIDLSAEQQRMHPSSDLSCCEPGNAKLVPPACCLASAPGCASDPPHMLRVQAALRSTP